MLVCCQNLSFGGTYNVFNAESMYLTPDFRIL